MRKVVDSHLSQLTFGFERFCFRFLDTFTHQKKDHLIYAWKIILDNAMRAQARKIWPHNKKTVALTITELRKITNALNAVFQWVFFQCVYAFSFGVIIPLECARTKKKKWKKISSSQVGKRSLSRPVILLATFLSKSWLAFCERACESWATNICVCDRVKYACVYTSYTRIQNSRAISNAINAIDFLMVCVTCA